MPPIDPDEEVLAALRESEDGGGLAGRIGRAARAANADDEPRQPVPAGLWAGIEAALPGFDPTAARPTSADPAAAAEYAEPSGHADPVESPDPAAEDLAPVVPLARPDARRRRRWWLGAGAAAAVIALVAVMSLVSSRSSADDLVAEVSLDALAPGESASGTARLVRRDGHLELDVATDGLAPAEGAYFELWMIDRDVTRLLSLGPLTGTRFRLPDDLDPASFPLVDISVESLDGDPGHSGDSVLRGVLEV